MKIISTVTNEENLKIVNALSIINGGLTIFNPNNHNTNLSDIMYRERPDILFIDNSFVNNYTQLILNKYRNTKVVLFGNYIDHDLKPDLICVSDNVSEIIKKHLAGENVAYIKDFCNPYLSNSMYFTSTVNDIACVTNSNKGFDEKINVFCKISKITNIKLYGEYSIPLPEYLGKINANDILSLYKSSNLVLDFGENNLMDMAFHKILLLTTIENDIFPVFNINSLMEQYSKLTNRKNRTKVINNAYEIVKDNTVLHRLKLICELLSEEDLLETIDTKIAEL